MLLSRQRRLVELGFNVDVVLSSLVNAGIKIFDLLPQAGAYRAPMTVVFERRDATPELIVFIGKVALLRLVLSLVVSSNS